MSAVRRLPPATAAGFNTLLKNSLLPRLLKKVQVQGGVTHQMGTRQMGLFQAAG